MSGPGIECTVQELVRPVGGKTGEVGLRKRRIVQTGLAYRLVNYLTYFLCYSYCVIIDGKRNLVGSRRPIWWGSFEEDQRLNNARVNNAKTPLQVNIHLAIEP